MTRKLGRCSCTRWQKNMPHLDDFYAEGVKAGIHYKVSKFKYCPWCGAVLTMEKDRHHHYDTQWEMRPWSESGLHHEHDDILDPEGIHTHF